ncbi:zf-HC2 domain-containing protein [Marinicrinis lubricantis]|uniref:Anti-sigma-W factor RsiW n=1 Tax=Marinicrinis lubricantis TaxID=2086470 RepID=A0ABW1INS7_9BACL
MMDCKEAISFIHEYFDGLLDDPSQQQLKQHLLQCADCQKRFNELEQTEAFLHSIPAPPVPSDLTYKVMAAIPQPKKRTAWMYWLKRHPAVTAAAVFLLIMISSVTAFWDQDRELVVKGSDLNGVVIREDQVIIPEGTEVRGDIVVENGQLQLEEGAHIEGNVVVIDGNLQLASTAEIGGKVTKVNQAIDWFWYKLGETFSNITN